MIILELLKAKWSLYGLDAPIFAWLAAAGLLLGTLCALGWLWWLTRRERRIHRLVVKKLDAIRDEHAISPREGLSHPAYDSIARAFEEYSPLLDAWRSFDAQVLVIRDSSGQDRFWATESAEAAFSDTTVIEPRLNRNFFMAIPGIVTGIGLLCTFMAILVALLDVRLVNNRVQGLENLIQGLSGKFVSSIAALSAATLFLLAEKRLLYRLAVSRQRLVTSIDKLIPRLTPARILADMHRDLAEQSIAFRHFNADLSTKFRQGVSESMGPTLERMVTTIEELSQILRAVEVQKQDSITAALDELLRNLERSINTTLEGVGAKFSESLSGSARQELDKVVKSLGGTSLVLEGMNTQFQATQASLNQLVTFAKSSTAEQMALGKAQVENLTAVLLELMAQIKETAGSSVTEMAATLTTVVHDLSTKVIELGQQMSSTLADSAGKAVGAANVVVEQTNTWSAQNAERLTELLERHQNHAHRLQDLQDTLDTTLVRFKEALGQHAGVTADLGRVSTHLSAIATSTAEAAKAMGDAQSAVQSVALLTKDQVAQLAKANRDQEETWKRIDQSMDKYQKVFDHVDKTAGNLLAQIQQHLRDYRETCKQGFEQLIKISDNHFANASQRLGSSVDDLEEYLQDLTEALEKGRNHNGNGTRQ